MQGMHRDVHCGQCCLQQLVFTVPREYIAYVEVLAWCLAHCTFHMGVNKCLMQTSAFCKLCGVMQFDNAWNGNWLSFCAGRETVNAMVADANKGTLLIHNGDISYAQ